MFGIVAPGCLFRHKKIHLLPVNLVLCLGTGNMCKSLLMGYICSMHPQSVMSEETGGSQNQHRESSPQLLLMHVQAEALVCIYRARFSLS